MVADVKIFNVKLNIQGLSPAQLQWCYWDRAYIADLDNSFRPNNTKTPNSMGYMHFPCTVQFATVQCRYKVLKLSKLDLMPFGWLRLAAKLNNITVWWFHKPFKISLALVPFHKYHIGILHTYRSPVVFQLALVVLWQSRFSVLTISTAENLF